MLDPQHLAALEQLAPVEARLVEFIERHLVDGHGLIRAHVNVHTLQPWTVEQLAQGQHQLHFYDVRRGDPVGQLTYEDSIMATGEYALSRMHKFAVTADPLALAAAAQPVHALLRVAEEGAKYERGYLPKPHGGATRAAYSHEISVDQYIKALLALRLWQQHCGPAQRRLIDELIVAMCDYHLVRKFQHPRREMMIVTPENRTHGMALFIPLLVLAHQITGQSHYREALRRFDGIIDELLTGAVPTNTNIVGLFMEGFDLALREGHQDDRLVRLLGRMWEGKLADIERLGLWHEDPTDTFTSSRGLRVAPFAPIVDHHLPGYHAHRLALKLLQGMTDPMQMLYANTPAEQLHPTIRFRASSLCETTLSSWLLAYWLLKGQRTEGT
jgi:hypothetical protein